MMLINEKWRIAYKAKAAPGDPVEMSIYRTKSGEYASAMGSVVAHETGHLVGWVKSMIDGTSFYKEGYLIAPPRKGYVGLVAESVVEPSIYFVCVSIGNSLHYEDWVNPFLKQFASGADVFKLVRDGEYRYRDAGDDVEN